MVLILDMSSNEWDEESSGKSAEEIHVAQPVELPLVVPRLVPVAEERGHHIRNPSRP